MTQTKALFPGLIFDEFDRLVETGYVGSESMYIVDDKGFKRHIPSEQVDRQVLDHIGGMIKGHEDLLTDQAAKMLGTDDIFSKARLGEQFKNIESQFDQMLELGIPEESLAYMGMTGFKVIINLHGELLEVVQPGMEAPEDE
jgi:hypothetical protein